MKGTHSFQIVRFPNKIGKKQSLIYSCPGEFNNYSTHINQSSCQNYQTGGRILRNSDLLFIYILLQQNWK